MIAVGSSGAGGKSRMTNRSDSNAGIPNSPLPRSNTASVVINTVHLIGHISIAEQFVEKMTASGDLPRQHGEHILKAWNEVQVSAKLFTAC